MIRDDDTREDLVAEIDRLRSDRDTALWLHAEVSWHMESACNGWTEQHKRADALQARIDAATEVTEEMLSQLVSGPERRDAEAIYEALTTDPA